MADSRLLRLEVAFGYVDRQMLLEVEVPEGTTAEQAVRQSGLLEQFPEIDLAVNHLGIFGRQVKPQEQPRDGDRIEVYRPLIADPKEVRKRRAAQGKQLKKGAAAEG